MDKELIIRRMADILKETPSGEEIVKKGGNRDKRFMYLARHMVEKAVAEDALLLSSDGLGIAIIFENNPKKSDNFWKKTWEDLGLMWNVTGIKNALKILKNQKYIKQQRPKDSNYLYVWFWGIVKDDRGPGILIASEMKNKMFEIAERKQLPIYSETKIRKNAVVYQRYKFENFHTWDHPDGGKMWFLRYFPESMRNKEEK